MKKYDLVVKDLFLKDHPSLLDRMTGGVAVREFLNVEFPTLLERRADLVLLLEDGRTIHIEFQSDNDRDMPYREGIYGLMIAQRYRCRVDQIVLYVGADPLRMEDHIDAGCVQVWYRLIDIRELDAGTLLGTGRSGDMALAILARGGPERLHEILERGKLLSAEERGRLFTQLAVFSGLRGLSNQLRMELKAMGSGYIDVESNPILQDWMEEAGRKEASKLVRRLLEQKFGVLPKWAAERLEAATTADIESWADRFLTATSINAVFGKD